VPFAPGIGKPSRTFCVICKARRSPTLAVPSHSFFVVDALENGIEVDVDRRFGDGCSRVVADTVFPIVLGIEAEAAIHTTENTST
jgi:hypothetical protein